MMADVIQKDTAPSDVLQIFDSTRAVFGNVTAATKGSALVELMRPRDEEIETLASSAHRVVLKVA
jgi:hypothetical protein